MANAIDCNRFVLCCFNHQSLLEVIALLKDEVCYNAVLWKTNTTLWNKVNVKCKTSIGTKNFFNF